MGGKADEPAAAAADAVAAPPPKRPPLKQRCTDMINTHLARCGMDTKARALTWHYATTLWEQIIAIVPISIVQVLALAIFFGKTASSPGLQAMGLIAACFGLVLFLDGLRVCIMPLAEEVGKTLPNKLPLWCVMIVAFFLGVLVTYAEPAIASLRPLARLVDPERAPYLYVVMNQRVEALVFAIGAGVGVAAVIGTLRFVRNWPLKPLIYATLAPTIGLSLFCQFGNSGHLAPLLGMAWDCGAVTTGPVTVPILLALGIGVMRSSRQKRLANAALHSSVENNAGAALEGFGIVTLASLFPILSVMLLGVFTSIEFNYDTVLQMARDAAANPPTEGPADKSPAREVIFAVRSITPLILALLILVKLVLRVPIPEISFWVTGGDGSAEDADGGKAAAQPAKGGENIEAAVAAFAADKVVQDDTASSHDADVSVGTGGGNSRTLSPMPSSVGKAGDVEAGGAPLPAKRGWKATLVSLVPLFIGFCMCQFGMMLFNIGLTYGFTALGDQTGETLPAAFMRVPYEAKSPYYPEAGGIVIVLLVIFTIGILATNAEPALNVLGATVEKLSRGAFTKKMLVRSVCVGVGVGMCLGAAKILWIMPIIWFIVAKYCVAVALTIITDDAIAAVAWDSAGVTTGPVTVPFVLSIGIGFSKAANASEGFGMLTIMSVAPIIGVLSTSLLRKPAAKAAAAARKGGDKAIARLSRSLSKTSSGLSGLGRTSRMSSGGGEPGLSKKSISSLLGAWAKSYGGANADPSSRDPSVRSGREFAAAAARDVLVESPDEEAAAARGGSSVIAKKPPGGA